jgi:hypothetical protein
MATWFFKTERTEYGPVSSALLKQYVETNYILPETLVRQSTDVAWIPAKKIKGLFTTNAEVIQENLPPKSSTNKLSLTGSLNCPQCGSDNTQKVSVIYHAGTTSGESDSGGIGMAYDFQGHNGTPMLVGAKTKTFQQTELARSFTPQQHNIPTGTDAIYLLILIAILSILWILLICLGLIGLISMYFLLAIIITTPLFLRLVFKFISSLTKKDEMDRMNHRKLMEENARLMAEWHKQYFCHKCGNIFIPSI